MTLLPGPAGAIVEHPARGGAAGGRRSVMGQHLSGQHCLTQHSHIDRRRKLRIFYFTAEEQQNNSAVRILINAIIRKLQTEIPTIDITARPLSCGTTAVRMRLLAVLLAGMMGVHALPATVNIGHSLHCRNNLNNKSKTVVD